MFIFSCIFIAMKICNYENCGNNVFGGGYCKFHQYLRKDKKDKPIKKTPIKRNYKPTGEDALFSTIIGTRRNYSFLSGLNIVDIDGVINNNNCHHVLYKKDYPDLRLYDRNIILITREEHTLIHFGTIEKRKEYDKRIIELYGKIVHWEKLDELKNELINEYKKIK